MQITDYHRHEKNNHSHPPLRILRHDVGAKQERHQDLRDRGNPYERREIQRGASPPQRVGAQEAFDIINSLQMFL